MTWFLVGVSDVVENFGRLGPAPSQAFSAPSFLVEVPDVVGNFGCLGPARNQAFSALYFLVEVSDVVLAVAWRPPRRRWTTDEHCFQCLCLLCF